MADPYGEDSYLNTGEMDHNPHQEDQQRQVPTDQRLVHVALLLEICHLSYIVHAITDVHRRCSCAAISDSAPWAICRDYVSRQPTHPYVCFKICSVVVFLLRI